MRAKTGELVSALAEAIGLLRKHGDSYWAEWLEEAKCLIEKVEARGIEHLLSAFGGMGSFNDVYISKENGHHVEDNEAAAVNDRLTDLRTRIYTLAKEISRGVARER